jgi:hypothetical protein
MLGVPRRLIEHSLNVDPKATPKLQHLRCFAYDRWDAIKKELANLLAASFIGEVFHPEWLANPVLIRKKNTNEWRMCIDYTDLNKHCPKDPFGLPRTDQVIHSTAGCDLLYFLGCYSGYHQIAIKEEDQEKTTFITPFGAYCYTTMSLGLKNAGATYQRAIQACFKKQLNKNLKAYVDDVVIKTQTPIRSSPILKRLRILAGVPVEAQPQQMCLRRTVRETTRLHHQPSWHRSQSREDLRHHQHESSHLH